MNIWDIIIIGIILLVSGLAVRHIIRNRGNSCGSCEGCLRDCRKCAKEKDIEKER